MSRYKEVYPTHEIAHLWANKSQATARNSQGNFYFRDSTIYSYGRHFPIARHVESDRNGAAVLLTTRVYSTTTAQHVGMVRQAIHGAKILRVYHPECDVKETMADFSKAIISAQENCFGPTGKFRPKSWSALETLIGQANDYAEYFGARTRWSMPADTESIKASIAKETARKTRADTRARKVQERIKAARLAKLAESLERWKAGESVDTYSFYDLPVALRVNGEDIETSHGASFPIDHGRRGIALVRAVVTSAKEWHANGHTCKLGNYSISSIDSDGTVHAGCHHVAYSEVERIAMELGMVTK